MDLTLHLCASQQMYHIKQVDKSIMPFNLQFLEKEQEAMDDDFDFRALEEGFVSICTSHFIIKFHASIS